MNIPQIKTKIADDRHDDGRIAADADDVGRDGLRDLHDGEDVGEEGCHGDDQQRRRADQCALHHDLGKVPQRQLLGDEEPDEEGVEHRHRRGLGGGEDAAQDPADDDDRHEQRRDALATC